MATWHLRPLAEGDTSFIFSSFLKSCRDAPAFSEISNTIYYAKLHERIEMLLDDPQMHIVVACDPAEPNVVFGYAIGEKVKDDLYIHWAYVKHPFRGFGLGKAMEGELLKIPHKRTFFSVFTRVVPHLNKSRNYVYDPFVLWSK